MTTKWQFLLGFVGFGASTAYYRYHESTHLELTHKNVPLGRGAGGRPLRLLHLSDFHASHTRSFTLAERAIALGLEARPDVACITGDFVTSRIRDSDQYSAILRRLSSNVPTYACLGNHDGGKWAKTRGGYKGSHHVRNLLAESGIRVLHNEGIVSEAGSRAVRIVAVADLWSGEMQPDRAFTGRKAVRDLPTVALAHNPDTKNALAPYAWDLLLAGHTHGGQVVLPWIGPVLSPVDDLRFVQGLHAWRGRKIHVTRGIGSIMGIRWNCRPEVSLLTLD